MRDLYEKDVVFISVDPWQEERWARKQMFAWLLSNSYRNVIYYIEPGRSERKFPHIKRIKNNLYLVDIPYIPQYLKHTGLSRLGVQISCFSLWSLMKVLRVKNPIFIIYQPQNLDFAKKLSSMFGKSLLCYDLTDDWSEFPGLNEWGKKHTRKAEDKVIKEVDKVFAVSEKLLGKARELNPNTFYLPNATSFENFNRVTKQIPISPEILTYPQPRIGYVGKITPWRIDFDLIRYISEARPDWSILMIGPVHPDARVLADELSKQGNVFFTGPKNYYSLPEYIKGFNVCILPHKIDSLTESMDPIKLYDYLATGKPIVASGIKEAFKFSNVIKIAHSKEQFLSFLDQIVDDTAPNDKSRQQIDIAKENSWENRTNQLIKILEENNRKQGS